MLEPVREILQYLRLADLLDIAIVSLAFYLTFVWLRDRASRSLAVVSVVLIALFAAARWLDLYLTTLALEYGSIVILIVLVVIFQNDIRHGFERLAASRLWQRGGQPDAARRSVDTIAEAIAHMADHQIGALIVFPGLQPLERHLRAGVHVDAEISLPLLLSIFHPNSPGHDGAVLIDRERVATLGLHLPLSKHLDPVHGSGTRHAAALGLAECSDATVLAVSEERGTISIAQDGKLSVIEPAELAEQLTRILDQGTGARPSGAGTRDLMTPLLAVMLASILWFTLAHTTETVQRTFVIPIEYRNVPDGWEIIGPQPAFVELTLSGTETAFALLDPATARVSLEVADVELDSTVRWEASANLKDIPNELQVRQLKPQSVYASFRKKAS